MMRLLTILFISTLIAGCLTRNPTSGEISSAQDDFKSTVPYSKIIISKRPLKDSEQITEFKKAIESIEMFRGLTEAQINEIMNRPFVIGNYMFFPKSMYSSDFSQYYRAPLDHFAWAEFGHEICHVWQNSNGITSEYHGGKPYHWTLALQEQLKFKEKVYEIPSPHQIKPSDQLSDFRFEQQCAIIQQMIFYSLANPDYIKPYRTLFENARDMRTE